MSKPIILNIKGIEIHGLQWGNKNGPSLLMLHGWLDNAASFFHIAPLLDHYNVIAVDLPGHGLSGHWPEFTHYHVWAGVEDIELILDALGWSQCHLVAHSMGAAMATLYAGTFPQRLTSLTLIEAIGPMAGDLPQAPQRLADAITKMKNHNSGQKSKPKLESFVSARLEGPLKLKERSAQLITQRSVKKSTDGFAWSNDKRLKYTSMMRLPEPLICSFIDAITCPVLGIFATDGLFSKEMLMKRWQVLNCHKQLEWLEGGHHLHLDGDVSLIAQKMNAFLDEHSEQIKPLNYL